MTRTQRFFAFLGYFVVSLVAACVFVELFSYLLLLTFRGRSTLEEGDIASSPAYLGSNWVPELLREEQSRYRQQKHASYHPFRIWDSETFHATYVNVDDFGKGAARRTINFASPVCDADRNHHRKVWIFGGSTVFGTGVPDFATIATYLSRHLNTDSPSCYEVMNFGVEGYVTNQEILFVDELLKRGLRPDIVIFYDGVNDAYGGALSPGTPLAHLDLERISGRVEGRLPSRLDFLTNSYGLRAARAIVARFHQGARRHPSKRQLTASAGATLANYESNVYHLQALARAYNFKALCFWQPAFIFGSKPLVPFERELLKKRLADPGGFVPAMRAVYELADVRGEGSKSFVFLGHLFDHVSLPLYLDGWMHLGPAGNDLVAERLADEIRAHSADEM